MTDYVHPFDDPEIPANPTPRVWAFAGRSDAYDAVQCNDDIRDGDILYIPPARVIGIATAAWPCAFTPLPPGTETDDLHTLDADLTWEQFAHGRYTTAVSRIRNPTTADLKTYAEHLGRPWEDRAEPLAYQYQAGVFCVDCVRTVARLVPGSENLRRLHHAAWHYEAALRGIDLSDESSYDSGDYPKPITDPASLWHEPAEQEGTPALPRRCGNCATPLVPDVAGHEPRDVCLTYTDHAIHIQITKLAADRYELAWSDHVVNEWSEEFQTLPIAVARMAALLHCGLHQWNRFMVTPAQFMPAVTTWLYHATAG